MKNGYIVTSDGYRESIESWEVCFTEKQVLDVIRKEIKDMGWDLIDEGCLIDWNHGVVLFSYMDYGMRETGSYNLIHVKVNEVEQ